MSNEDATHIITCIQQNFNGFMTTMPLIIGGEHKQIGGASTYFTGIPFPLLNGVISTDTDDFKLAQTIQETQTYFKSKGVAMLWWAFPTDKPSNLVNELERYGFVKAGEDPGMAVKLKDLTNDIPLIPGLEIVKVEDLKTMKVWNETVIKGFGLPEFLIEPMTDMCMGFNAQNKGRLVIYMAKFEGRPVGTSLVYLMENGVAGIYNVATLPESRKMGIGRTLTLLPLIEARQEGQELGILASSKLGYNVYRRLGFQEYCKVKTFLWNPEEA